MGLGVGSAALVTGGGAGIGRAACLALAKRGVTITVVEFSTPDVEETVRLIEAEHAKLAEKPQAPSATFTKCDVSVPAGVVMFSRSLEQLIHKGIRVNAICAEFVETNLTKQIRREIVQAVGGYISMDTILKGIFELVEDESRAGQCLWVTNRRGSEYWPTEQERAKYARSS